MDASGFENRVSLVEHRMEAWERRFGDAIAALTSQISHQGEEIRAGDEETRRVLREEIRAGDEETRRYMRVLHEDVIERITRLGETP